MRGFIGGASALLLICSIIVIFTGNFRGTSGDWMLLGLTILGLIWASSDSKKWHYDGSTHHFTKR
ncbi:hypothetical protein ACTRXD_00440 [Nitrospira sp. T9]|uniref:hypothetical protein n=1 Tax=unclassified Nitrospira TaxID=2652172 RepID=UPI003F9B4718